MSAERLQRIHEAIQRHIDAGEISGAVTLVARRGRIVHFEAHGLMDIESKRPMQKDAIFRIASMSKPITGVAVMMMLEEGKLRLNDPVSKFLPEFKNSKVAIPRGNLRRFYVDPGGSGTHHPRPADAHQRPDDRRHRIEGRALRGRPRAIRWRSYIPGWRRSRSTSSPARNGLIADTRAPTRSRASWKSFPGQPYDEFLRTRIFRTAGDEGYVLLSARRPPAAHGDTVSQEPQRFGQAENQDGFSLKRTSPAAAD